MNLIGKRKIWYAISLVMIVPGMVSLAMFGLRLGIDFSSGQLSVVRGTVSVQTVRDAAAGLGFNDIQVVASGSDQTQIRFRDPSPQGQHEANHQKLKSALARVGVEEL